MLDDDRVEAKGGTCDLPKLTESGTAKPAEVGLLPPGPVTLLLSLSAFCSQVTAMARRVSQVQLQPHGLREGWRISEARREHCCQSGHGRDYGDTVIDLFNMYVST